MDIDFPQHSGVKAWISKEQALYSPGEEVVESWIGHGTETVANEGKDTSRTIELLNPRE